jgi:hypothetical protein
VAILLAAVLVAPPAAVAYWAVVDGDGQRAFTAAERGGVAYLGPLTRLLATLVAGQSAGVRGDPVDIQAIHEAADLVGVANREHGKTLKTEDRWTALSTRIQALTLTAQRAARGEDAYRQWSEAVGLATALATRVGDTSNLILDPELDSNYLMDAGLLRLPMVIQAAGQVADLVAIAGSASADELHIAVLRDRVAAGAAAVSAGLGKAIDATASRRVGTALLGPLDRFGAAADAFAPTADVMATPPLPANVPAAALGVQLAAVQLADGVWLELDSLLDERLSRLDRNRTRFVAVGGAGMLLAIVVVVFAMRPRRRYEGPARAARSQPIVPAADPPVPATAAAR